MDGSPPGYHIHRGFGSGANNWLINLEVRRPYTRTKYNCWV